MKSINLSKLCFPPKTKKKKKNKEKNITVKKIQEREALRRKMHKTKMWILAVTLVFASLELKLVASLCCC